MQEGRVGMPRRPRHHRVAFVTTGTNGVEDLVLHTQHARHQVQVATDQLRFEEFAEALCVQRTALQNRVFGRGLAVRRAVPGLHEFDEIDIANFGAVEPLHACGDRIGNGCEHGFLPLFHQRMRVDVGMN